jgi:glycosyltransferase involved in cell wall biosynthesis
VAIRTFKMNILFISSLYPSIEGLRPGKVTRALHNMVKLWNREEKVIVVCPVYIYLKEVLKGHQPQPLRKPFKKRITSLDNVTILVYPIFKIPRLAYFYYPLYRYLDKYLETIGFVTDIVVAHYDKSLIIGFQYSRMKHLPFVAGFHATPDLMENNPKDFTKRCAGILEAANVIACRSFYIYNKIRGWFPHYQPKCFVAFSGLDEKLIEDKKLALAKLKQWKKPGKVLILSVSSLIDLKNVDVNLKALAQLKDKIDWTYTIIGEGKERPNLEALVAKLGIEDRVRFMGAISHQEVIEEMKRSHFFVMVSFMETFGLVYLEALAAGNIVIGSRDEGIDGVIENAKNGFLSPAGEVEPLKEVLEEIILRCPEDKLGKILIEANRTIRQYTEKKAAQNYLNQIRKIV